MASKLVLIVGSLLFLASLVAFSPARFPDHRPTNIALNRPSVTSVRAGGSEVSPANWDLERGWLAFERGDYRVAHDRMIIAAQDGEPAAQELVGLMYALGPEVYPGIEADAALASDWLELAARNGQSAAQQVYCAMVRRAFPDRRFGQLQCFDGRGEIMDVH